MYLIAGLHLITHECNMLKYNCLTSWCAVANVCNVFLAVACYLFVHVIVLVFCSVRIILNKTACKSEISLQLLVLSSSFYRFSSFVLNCFQSASYIRVLLWRSFIMNACFLLHICECVCVCEFVCFILYLRWNAV